VSPELAHDSESYNLKDRARGSLIFRFFNTRASGFALILLLLIAWESSVRSGAVVSPSWPAFSQIVVSLFAGLMDGELPRIMLSTLARTAEGYLIGVGLGVALGLLMATVRPIRRTLEPALELLRPIPTAAIIPPLIFVFGIDDSLKVFIVAFAVLFPVWINTMAGVRAVDPLLLQVAQTFQYSRGAAFRLIVLPCSLPYVLAGMRISLGIALVVAIVAEMISGSEGIGHYMLLMQYAQRSSDMYAAVILLSVTGYLLNYSFVVLESRIIHWERAQENGRN